MDFAHTSAIRKAGVIFFRVLIRYGIHHIRWDDRHIEKLFKHLLLTLDTLIFFHKDYYISKERSRLRADRLKQLLKQCSSDTSLSSPVVFEAQFILDCDSNDAGPRAEISSLQKSPCGIHQLNVDALFSVEPISLEGDLFSLLRDEVQNYLKSYKDTLKSILLKEKTIPRSLTAYYFLHEDQLIRVLYPPATKDEIVLREEIHKGTALSYSYLLFY